MSSGGQAPNVSMDELLSSIKSMIEGESTEGLSSNNGMSDVGAGGPEPAPPPDGALDAGIMDLTQVVQPPVAAQEQPAGGVPQNANPQSAEETAAQINDILGGMSADLGVSNDDLVASANPADQVMDGFEPQAPAGEQEQPQSPQDIDFGLPEGLGVARGGETPVDPAAGQPMDVMAGQDPALSQAPQAKSPDMGQDPVATEANAMTGDLSAPPDLAQSDGPQTHGELTRGLNGGMKPDASGQGLPPVGGQGMGMPQGQPQGQPPGQAFQPQSGQPPLGQVPAPMPVPQQGVGVQPGPMGQPPHPQVGGAPGVMPAPHGQPLSQQPGGHDPRLESEFAMGQALSQADASLSASPALQQQMVPGGPVRGVQPPAPQGYPQGQMPGQMLPGEAGAGYDLPVPAAGRAMVPAQQPMMPVADPSVDQLPVEMRNNLEEIVKQLLKPLLREWLERNLPELLKGAVDEKGKIDPDRL